ncbi:hypothetical protein [Glycomyces arizonensis]|uniref:hypothetical protein n=1 Tax=Glycomyces arizonensis TaxID=256035 RepID=UPI00047BDC3B|nr:hypothetical protein [Glycomyces arizonensis]
MLHLTWDTNCIITMESDTTESKLEYRAADKAALVELLALHDAGKLEIRIPAAMASETQVDGSYIQDFEELRARFAADGLERLASVPQPAPTVFGQAFWGQMAFADDRLREIFSEMFPGASFDGPREGENKQKWWGRRIDAAVYWGHINSGGDLLVTADRTGFIKGGTREKLLAIGGREIATPVDSVAWVNSQLT